MTKKMLVYSYKNNFVSQLNTIQHRFSQSALINVPRQFCEIKYLIDTIQSVL